MVKEDLPGACFLTFPDRILTGLYFCERNRLAFFFLDWRRALHILLGLPLKTAIFYRTTDAEKPGTWLPCCALTALTAISRVWLRLCWQIEQPGRPTSTSTSVFYFYPLLHLPLPGPRTTTWLPATVREIFFVADFVTRTVCAIWLLNCFDSTFYLWAHPNFRLRSTFTNYIPWPGPDCIRRVLMAISEVGLRQILTTSSDLIDLLPHCTYSGTDDGGKTDPGLIPCGQRW